MIATREIARRLRAKRPERLTDPATPFEAKVARVQGAILAMEAARLHAEQTPRDRRNEWRANLREWAIGALVLAAIAALVRLLLAL